MIDNAKLQQFATEHKGRHYNAVRQPMHSIDWDGWYPEVDRDGKLTGSIVPADQYGYSVCDVSAEAVCVHGTAEDAVIVDD